MKITLVKKRLPNGEPCRKCADVMRRLEDGGYLDRIDAIVDADESDPDSPGMVLARAHDIYVAPFFIVEDDNGDTDVYTTYLKFARDILDRPGSA